jgi:hypothetical protein
MHSAYFSTKTPKIGIEIQWEFFKLNVQKERYDLFLMPSVKYDYLEQET